MKYIIITLLAIFTFTCAAYAEGPIEQVAYFKDKARNRIFTHSYKPGTTEQEIKKHAEALMNTDWRMTAGYYYIEGSVIPANGLVFARDVMHANHVLYDLPGLSKWQYSYMKFLNGTSQFVNCKNNPKSDFCRQK